jgi:hypothetical protein
LREEHEFNSEEKRNGKEMTPSLEQIQYLIAPAIARK